MSRVCDSRSATPTNPLIQYDSAVSADILFSRAEYCISRPLRSCPCFNTRLCVRRNPALINLIFSCRLASQITPVFEYIYMCPLESCSCQLSIQWWVGQSDHSHIYIHVHVSGGILYSQAGFWILGSPLRSLHCLKTIVLFAPDSRSHEHTIYHTDQHIHPVNTQSSVRWCDDSGIPVHNRISGWSHHPSIQCCRFRPFDCYAITVHDCIRLTNLHTNVILSHVSATMITPRFQYTMQYQADRHIHLVNTKS